MSANRSTRERPRRLSNTPAPRDRERAHAASQTPTRKRARRGRDEGRASAPETLSRRLARLNTRRQELGCSQAELARMLGVSASSVSRLFGPDERKRPRDLIGVEGMQRVELALRLLGQAAPNARVTPPATHEWSSRAQSPHPQTARALSSGDPAQPPLLSDSGIYLIPGGKMRRARGPVTYRLLLAEDDADTVNLYQMVFADGDEMIQYAVTVARTAEECVARLREDAASFDLLVMDLGIAEPREGAPDSALLPWLRAHPELRPPRMLVVSGVSPYQLQARLVDLRALDATFLPKPFDVDEVLETVRALCERPIAREGDQRPAPATV